MHNLKGGEFNSPPLIKRGANTMKRQFPVSLPDGYVDFYKNLETWQNTQQIKLNKEYSSAKVDVLDLLSTSNKPILKSLDYKVDANQYKTLFSDFLLFMKDSRKEITEVLDKLANQIDLLDFSVLDTKLLENDHNYFIELSTQLDVPHELLIFLIDHAFRPFLRVFATPYYEDIVGDDLNSWDFANICPVCGSKPHISRLRASDGRRFMFCDRCFTEWESRYLFCVHCGNNEPGTIKYTSIESDEAYQIYTCEKCKGYQKTYDERKSGDPTDLFIANMETIYLDMLAQDNGYTNHDLD